MHWSLLMIIPLVVFGVFVALGYRLNRPPEEGRGGMGGGFHQGILVGGCLVFVLTTIGNRVALIPMGMALVKMHGECQEGTVHLRVAISPDQQGR